MIWTIDPLALTATGAFALLVAITLGLSPAKHRRPGHALTYGLVIAGTVVGYLAASPWLLLAGWVITATPFFLPGSERIPALRTATGLSAVLLAAGLAARAIGSPALDTAGMGLIVLAALLRQGAVPFHTWVLRAGDTAPLPLLSLVLNAQAGAYLLLRTGLAGAGAGTTVIIVIAVAGAIVAALRALTSTQPRRTLIFVQVSQSAWVLSGILSRTEEGVTGAILHWWVLALGMGVLFGVLAALQQRTTEVESPSGYLGFGFHAPRLAGLYGLAALAVIGAPGTLGFISTDLLFDGALASSPWLGAALLAEAAMSAIATARLFARIFLGRRGADVPAIPEAHRRERWVLTPAVVLLVVGGVAPQLAVDMGTRAVSHILASVLNQ